jgi:hypothetical protein
MPHGSYAMTPACPSMLSVARSVPVITTRSAPGRHRRGASHRGCCSCCRSRCRNGILRAPKDGCDREEQPEKRTCAWSSTTGTMLWSSPSSPSLGRGPWRSIHNSLRHVSFRSSPLSRRCTTSSSPPVAIACRRGASGEV